MENTVIMSDVVNLKFPFIFKELIHGQGYKVTITLPSTPAEFDTLLRQAEQSNPAQVAAAHAAGTP